MPLYRKRPAKRTFLSQETKAEVSQEFKKPFFCSQGAAEKDFENVGKMMSPIYPEVFPRVASVPNESAFDDHKFENKTSTQLAAISSSQVECSVFKSEIQNGRSTTENVYKTTLENLENTGSLSEISNTEIGDNERFSVDNKEISRSTDARNENKESEVAELEADKENKISRKKRSEVDKNTEYANNLTDDSKDLNVSLNSSVSSIVSLNYGPVKEAFKQFLIEKENKGKKRETLSQNSDISLNDPVVREAYTQFMRKKEKFARVNTPRGLTHYEKMKWLQEQRNVGVYVYCDRCDKVRYLDEIRDPTILPDKWYCEDNKDLEHNKCEIPQEKIPLYIQEDWIENLYNAGSIVWARVEGFPWWPGMVDDDPDTESYYWLENEFDIKPTYYHVTFLDQKEVERAWLKPKDIKSFYKEKKNPNLMTRKFSIFKDRIDFAINQAMDALDMTIKERLEKFSFVTRYKKPIKKPRVVKDDKMKEGSKLKKDDFVTNKKGKNVKGTKKEKAKNKEKSCAFLMEDFEIPTSLAIDNISLDLFENV